MLHPSCFIVGMWVWCCCEELNGSCMLIAALLLIPHKDSSKGLETRVSSFQGYRIQVLNSNVLYRGHYILVQDTGMQRIVFSLNHYNLLMTESMCVL